MICCAFFLDGVGYAGLSGIDFCASDELFTFAKVFAHVE